MLRDRISREIEGFRKLCKIEKSLHRLSEADCNYGLTPRQEKRETRLAAEAEQIAQDYFGGAHVYHQGDPRGCVLYLYLAADLELLPKMAAASVHCIPASASRFLPNIQRPAGSLQSRQKGIRHDAKANMLRTRRHRRRGEASPRCQPALRRSEPSSK